MTQPLAGLKEKLQDGLRGKLNGFKKISREKLDVFRETATDPELSFFGKIAALILLFSMSAAVLVAFAIGALLAFVALFLFINAWIEWYDEPAWWIIFILAAPLVIVILGGSFSSPSRAGSSNKYGNARWASRAEIESHRLVGNTGIFMGGAEVLEEGQWRGAGQMSFLGETSLITVAPSGSGKGTTAIIPTLVNYDASMIVNDPKGELAAVTARHRNRHFGHDVFILNPFNVLGLGTCRVNPLADLDPAAPTFTSDIDTLAASIVLDDDKASSHWVISARNLLSGIIAYVCLTPAEPRTLARVNALVHLPQLEFTALMFAVHALPFDLARHAAAPFLSDRPPKSVFETLTTLQGQLATFLNAAGIQHVLSASDFSFSNLKARPMTLYVVIPEAEAKTYKRFTRLIVASAIKALQRAAPAERPPVLFILDELATSIGGGLDVIQTQFSLGRGHGIQLWGIVQNLSQLREVFGENHWHSVMASSELVQFFRPNDPVTVDYIKTRAGTYTGRKVQTSTSTGTGADGRSNTSRSTSTDEEKLDFFTTQDLYGFPHDAGILFKKGLAYPIFQRRIPYWEFENLAWGNRLSDPNPYHERDARPANDN